VVLVSPTRHAKSRNNHSCDYKADLAQPVGHADPSGGGRPASQAMPDDTAGVALDGGDMADRSAAWADAAIGHVHRRIPKQVGARVDAVGTEPASCRVACLKPDAKALIFTPFLVALSQATVY
jgi:hypothetical protein